MGARVQLIRRRYAAGAINSTPVSIPATSLGQISVEVPKFATLPDNTRCLIEVMQARLVTDSTGAVHLTIQSATLGAGPDAESLAGDLYVGAPAFSGAPLGLANQANFQGSLMFWSDELDALGISRVEMPVALTVLCYNGDSSAHSLNSLSLKARATLVTFDEPVYE